MKIPNTSRKQKILSLLCILLLPLVAAALEPVGLSCNYLENPLGIDSLKPRLSWTLEASSRRARAESQTASQILVASSQDLLREGKADLWDSGRILGANSLFVEYAGKPLDSEQICFWKVRVWDQNGKATDWSAAAHWSMGLLKASDWKGRWIGLDGEERSETLTNGSWIWFPEGTPEKSAPCHTAWFRKSFALPAGRVVSSAKLLVTADNQFEAYLNGTKVGQDGNFKTVSVYEVAGLLRGNQNVLAVSAENVGSGPNPAGLLAVLQVQFESGEPLIITTDDTWRSSLEPFDGWQKQNFDDSIWLSAAKLGPAGMKPWGEISLPEQRKLPARYLRKEFTVKKSLSRATVYYSGLGLSELHINGRKIGDEVLSPALSEYNKRVFYLTKDITEVLRKGQNTIGVILGNGRFFAPRSSSPIGTRSYGFPKLLLQARLEFSDGSNELLVSDDSWNLTTEGPIRANNEYDGEEYDARLEQEDWDRPGKLSQNWVGAALVSSPAGELRAQPSEPIRKTQSIKPLSVNEITPGVFIFDMGQNLVGWCTLRVSGPAGTVAKLRHAETLKADGTLYLDNIRGAKVTDSYILKGSGRETYEPTFTYHGFRYVELTGFPGKPSLSTISGNVVHDDLQPAGSFACSNPLVNQIYSNVLWGVRGNYRSIPTDCPQRDERQGWLGDRAEECRGETYLFRTAPLYSKWLQDMADTQKENGSISDVCPSYWPLFNDNVTWPSAFLIIPATLHQQFGDSEPIAAIYPEMKQWLKHMAGFVTNGIISRDNYGDWCVPPEDPKLIHSKDPARKTDPSLLATAYLYYDATLMHQYALLLEKTQDAQEFERLAESLKKALNEKFFDSESGFYANGAQTASVLPLAFGIAPESERDRIFTHLIDKIAKESNNHVGTGLIGAQWLMRTLSRNGRPDLAWTILTQDTYPSWGYMVRKGATTIWELWNGDTADPAMNSGNHVMLVGDLITWLFEDIAGIRPAPQTLGFSRILMRPQLPPGLDWVRASHVSPYGLIRSEWKKDGSRFEWMVRIPPNSKAELVVPGTNVRESGKPVSEAAYIHSVASDERAQTVEIGSGTYNFTSDLKQ